MEQQLFEQMYQGQAPWDTGRPQPDVIKLAESGKIRGSVLDVGCGTGEHVLYFAARGHECWGIDFVPVAIERAKAKAAKRGIKTTFLVGNALELGKFARQFDTVIDCGLYHTFSDEERPVFVRGSRKFCGPAGSFSFCAFPRKSRAIWGHGGLPKKKSAIRSKTAGRCKASSRRNSTRLCRPTGHNSVPAARRLGWLRSNGSERFSGTPVVY